MKFSEFLETCGDDVNLRVRIFLFGTFFYSYGGKSYFKELPALHDFDVEYFYTDSDLFRQFLVVSLKYSAGSTLSA